MSLSLLIFAIIFLDLTQGPDVVQKESVHLALEKGLRAFSNSLKMMPD